MSATAQTHLLDEIPVLRIAPPTRWWVVPFGELWAYRELIYFFVWRDIKIRYKQTAIGAAWAVLQPFLTMLIFTLFFGRLAHIPSGGLPYPIFYYSALLPWMYFAAALQNATSTIVDNQRLITKVYFPRLALPISSVCSGLVDFGVSFLMFVALMAYYRVRPTSAIPTAATPPLSFGSEYLEGAKCFDRWACVPHMIVGTRPVTHPQEEWQ